MILKWDSIRSVEMIAITGIAFGILIILSLLVDGCNMHNQLEEEQSPVIKGDNVVCVDIADEIMCFELVKIREGG